MLSLRNRLLAQRRLRLRAGGWHYLRYRPRCGRRYRLIWLNVKRDGRARDSLTVLVRGLRRSPPATRLVPGIERDPRGILLGSRNGLLRRLGSFAVRPDPSIGAAVEAFGPPTSRTPDSATSCTVRWDAIGLAIGTANFGGVPEGRQCSNRYAYSQTAVLAGEPARIWQTERGLRVGDPLDRLRSLYPGARYRDDAIPDYRGWPLHSAQLPYGPDGLAPIVWAKVRDGLVQEIRVWVGGAGD